MFKIVNRAQGCELLGEYKMNYLKLRFYQDYSGTWIVTDENYDGAPDSGWQPMGTGRNKYEALTDYLECNIESDYDYVISAKDLI